MHKKHMVQIDGILILNLIQYKGRELCMNKAAKIKIHAPIKGVEEHDKRNNQAQIPTIQK